jgi:hypothetical protein
MTILACIRQMLLVTGRELPRRMQTDATVRCGDESLERRHHRVRTEVLVEDRENSEKQRQHWPAGCPSANAVPCILLSHLPEHVRFGALG